MTRYLLSDAVVGTAAERPDASDPLAGASSVPTALYIESDTGAIKLSTGEGWVTVGQMTVGTLPAGVTSDGLTPGGLVVAGGIAAGDPNTVSQFNLTGIQSIQDTPDPLTAVLEIDQTAESVRTQGNKSVLKLVRGFQPTYHTVAAVVFLENDDTSSTAPAIQYAGPSGGQGFLVGLEGGIGTHGHAAQVSPRTLAQAAITAITDTNAKTAVQACANALADIGALTLT